MKLLFIFGDGAVGKMTVGQELAKITPLRLFHNHMTIEVVQEVFGSTKWDTTFRLRRVIFEDFAATDNYGLIFTFMMDFDSPFHWDYIAEVAELFKKHNADIYYAELFAPLDMRLARNKTENRLKHKPSKRDIEMSEDIILNFRGRFNSHDGEIPFKNYIKIDNTDILAADAALMIKERFSL